MFLSRNNKINVYPCKPQFYCIKVGSILYRHVFVMEEPQQGVSKVCPQRMFPCRKKLTINMYGVKKGPYMELWIQMELV